MVFLKCVNTQAHDVTEFVREDKHPGGKKILIAHNGKDGTIGFNGGVYNHTNAARNLMSHMRVAKMNSFTNFIEDGPIAQSSVYTTDGHAVINEPDEETKKQQ